MSEVGKFIKNIRIKNKMSISELARESEISRPYLSQIESGKRGVPSPDILKKIAIPLNVNYTELMEIAGYINKHDYLLNEVKQGLILMNQLIDNMENDIAYYETKINTLNSELENIVEENLSDEQLQQFIAKEKYYKRLITDKNAIVLLLEDLYSEKKEIENLYSKLDNLLSQSGETNNNELSNKQEKIEELLNEHQDIIDSLSINVKNIDYSISNLDYNNYINDIYFHLQEKNIEKTYKTIPLNDYDKSMIKALIEAYLITKIKGSSDLSTNYLDVINDFEFPD